jgi:hypothetical protein
MEKIYFYIIIKSILKMRTKKNEIENHWTDYAKKALVGRKIVKVRYLSDGEMEHMGWHHKPIVLHLDDDTLLFPSADDEGNDGGAIFFCNHETSDGVIPVI